MSRVSQLLIIIAFAAGLAPIDALAQRRGGGARASSPATRASARPSVNRSQSNVDRSNVNRDVNRNVNRDVSRDVHRDVDIDRDIDIDNDWDCCDHPVAAAAAVTAAAVTTAAVMGSVAYALPPACTTVVVDGLSYYQCGSTWYQPQFVGTSTSYLVVGAPR